MLVGILFLSFAVLLLLGAPIAIYLGSSSLLTMLVQGAGKPIDAIMAALPRIVSASTSKFVLLAIPFFILGGTIMERAGISRRLIELAESLVGHIKGGVALVCIIVSCFFAAISGSGPATVAALGLIMIPAMVKAGYDPAFSAALMAVGGAIGVIIPPSINFVVYGSIADASIGTLFIGGIIPGLMMGAALVIVALWVGRRYDLKTLPRATWSLRGKAFKDAFWGLLMPIIILGGIYGGVFTPTEAAAVSAVYGLFVGIFIYRSVKIKELYSIMVDAASVTSTVMFITAAASLFAYILTRARIDVAISTSLIELTGGNFVIFLLVVNLVLLLAGCFLDSTSALFIFTPLFVPVARALNIDIVHFGVVMIVNLAIGLVTPPVGVNLFVACGIAGIDVKTISRAVVPLIIASLVVLALVTYVPFLSLALT
ncbi:MAG: TRAP transporter large permease [Planctomycetaceae bacterium]|nr:TRAP transporter large permease [Planctomycetaceae bacterium]